MQARPVTLLLRISVGSLDNETKQALGGLGSLFHKELTGQSERQTSLHGVVRVGLCPER